MVGFWYYEGGVGGVCVVGICVVFCGEWELFGVFGVFL